MSMSSETDRAQAYLMASQRENCSICERSWVLKYLYCLLFLGRLRMPAPPELYACLTDGLAVGSKNFGIVDVTVGLAGAARLSLANEARQWLKDAMVSRRY